MGRKQLLIFEGLKGAGKTLLINQFIKEHSDSCAFFEEETLRPIKHETNVDKIKEYYDKLVDKCAKSDAKKILMDRFYFTKWESLNYNKQLFADLEKNLIKTFDVSLISLIISEKNILERLEKNQKYREPTGWKLNYDGVSIKEEAKRDAAFQKFFLENHYEDSLIQNKIIIDTTNVDDLIKDTKRYADEICKKIIF